MRFDGIVEAATECVSELCLPQTGFVGALLAGSSLELRPQDELSPFSDVDILALYSDRSAVSRPGKVVRDGIVFEVSTANWAEIADVARASSSYWLAPTLSRGVVLSDAKDWLVPTVVEARRSYRRPSAVRRRCDDVVERARGHLMQASDSVLDFPALQSWFFATAVQCHLALVAALRNPTGRLRYLRVRELWQEESADQKAYEALLDVLGCTSWTVEQTRRHFTRMTEAFDYTSSRAGTIDGRYASDVTGTARTATVEGTRHLLDNECHREAVFWIGVTLLRCQALTALRDADAAKTQVISRHVRDFFADLGVTDLPTLSERIRYSRASLEQVRRFSLEIARVGEP